MKTTSHTLVGAATQLIQSGLANSQLDAALLSHQLAVDPSRLDSAFWQCRGRSCRDEIDISRASRLFKLLGDNPLRDAESTARRCGFPGLSEAQQAFQLLLGIDLESFLNTSRQALEDRQVRRDDPNPERLTLSCVSSPAGAALCPANQGA